MIRAEASEQVNSPGNEAAFWVRIATTPDEIAACLQIRRRVFVEEQGIFTGSDLDDYDERSIHIMASLDGRIVGTVRCYRRSGRLWYGGRLAVLPEYRVYNIGALLVRKAVETMRLNPEVSRFLATVQIQNVRFFKRLGWIPVGRSIYLKGVKHQVMESPLDRAQAVSGRATSSERSRQLQITVEKQ